MFDLNRFNDSAQEERKELDQMPMMNNDTLIILGVCLGIIAASLWLLWALLCVRNSGWCGYCAGLGPKSREVVDVDGKAVPLVVVPNAESSGSGK